MPAWIGARELALVRGEAVMDDIVIRGGQVIDGTGAPARVAHVAIPRWSGPCFAP
jgi:ribulose 1,5-bisphosphate synthetase/thiazole synthase